MTAQMVADALLMAAWRRGRPNELLHHSDRGGQYTSEQFQRLMADSGIVCGMSRSGMLGQCGDGKRFFSSLKTERTAGKTCPTRWHPMIGYPSLSSSNARWDWLN